MIAAGILCWSTGETTHTTELGAEETVNTAGDGQASAADQEAKSFPPVMSCQGPLLTKLTILPSGGGKLFKGPISIFPEQLMKYEVRAKR